MKKVSFFIFMDIFLKIIGIFGLIAVMVQAAHYLVGSSSAIAKYFKVSDLVIGLTIVSIGTSAPEMVASISATIQGSGDIAVSNIVGSNIYNLGIILGIVAVMSKIAISKKILFRDVLGLAGLSLLQYYFFFDGVAERLEGFIVLLLFGVWLYFVFKTTTQDEIADEISENIDTKHIWKQWGIFIVALVFLVGSGHLMVDLASNVATVLGVSEWLIGLLIVGVGTSTPELITSVVALKKGSHGISIGNLFGSDIFNQAFILGVATMIVPITTTGSNSSGGFMFIALYVLFLFALMWWDKKLSRTEGIIILLVVSARFAWEIWRGLA